MPRTGRKCTKAAAVMIATLGHAARLRGPRVVYLPGGRSAGPGLRGEAIGGGAWEIARRDGALELGARDGLGGGRGGLVQVLRQGVRHGPPEVLARLARGEEVEP